MRKKLQTHWKCFLNFSQRTWKLKKYKTIIFPVVLYSWGAWSLTLKEERRLRVFENRILRRIFGPKREANGEWRRLHNEELLSLYRSSNIVRVIKSRILRSAGHVARMEEGRRAFKILTDTFARKRPLGRPRRSWEDYSNWAQRNRYEYEESGWFYSE